MGVVGELAIGYEELRGLVVRCLAKGTGGQLGELRIRVYDEAIEIGLVPAGARSRPARGREP